MVSPSEKKRKISTVEMKAAIAKQETTVLIAPPVSTIASPNRPGREQYSSVSPSLKSKIAAISHPLLSKIYPPLSNTSFLSLIYFYSKDGTDMLAELSKNILNDFDLNHKKKQNNTVVRQLV